MTTKIAIKPQSEYTAEELRALDERAAGFVGRELVYLGFDEELKAPIDQESGSLWHPTSTNAPLWQLGMVSEKIVNQPKLRKVFMDRLRGFKKSSCDFDGKQNLFFKHPATVLAAILNTVNNE